MPSSSSTALSAESILDYMVKSLPTQPTDSEQSPLVKDPYAAIALFSHACMLAVGFRLIGLGEDHKLEAQSDSENVRSLPAEWTASSSYAFRYAHSQSSMEFLVKVNRLGGKALIFGVGLPDEKTASFEVKAQEYISEGSIKETTTASDQTSALRNVFISNGRITDLASLFKVNIIQKLAPGIAKAGYEETTSTTQQRSRQEEPRAPARDPLRDDQPQPARPYPFDDPLAAVPRRPQPAGDFLPPEFEDEYELNRPARGMAPLRQPFGNIGDRDLYPPGLGPNDPLRMGPGGGFRGGGGMHPTFDDPLFGGQGGQQPYDPRAPPGARYDPIGPGDGPPNLGGGPRFPGGGSGGFGGGNPFGGFGSGDFI
ncbi:PI31 proteasome regulator N-terminal-domain-containing protein [Exophiala viscosa]|uniref:PI31 proteasome regulator N-terminal-domain-containing protein n=1 Tax=Exophiala viscosa TaxID=2486360 RepID=UPI00219F24DC|nr:PI31 proteasome regulator N-terminal-domain-containing protein [Exophiala viscosa]